MYYTTRWRRLRKQALILAEFKCKHCGCSVQGPKMSRVDHIIPVKKRPDLAFELSNLQVLCPPCDNRKHWEKFPNGKEKKPVKADGSPEGESWS